MTSPARTAAVSGLLMLVALSCDSKTEAQWRKASELGEIWPSPDGRLLMTQDESGDVLAIDSRSGELEWRYAHFGMARHRIIEFPRPRLICPPGHADAGIIYLLFSDRLVSLSSENGHVRWRRPIRTPYSRGMCPAVTPDSSLVLLVRRGHGLVKIDPSGAIDWSFTFPDRAVARAGPTVVRPSGNVLVRTGNRVFSVNPRGELSYDRVFTN